MKNEERRVFMSQKRKVVRVRRPMRLGLGFVVTLFAFLYVIILSVNYFNKKHISIYEVTETNIAKDNRCIGIILRKEQLERAPVAGYVNYYVADRDRVGKNATIYSIDESGNVYEMLSNTDQKVKLSDDDISGIRSTIASFHKAYNPQQYQQLSTFKSSIDGTVLELSSVNMLSSLRSVLDENELNSSSFRVVKSPASGIISYYVDEYSNLTADNVTTDMFEKDYENEYVRKLKAVEAGSTIYKLITNDKWQIVMNLSAGQYEKLKERETELAAQGYETPSMTIKLIDSNITTTVYYELYKKGNGYFAKVDMSRYMINYIDDRFVEIELSFNSAEGLKIPNSAIIEQEFFLVPLDYLTQGADDDSLGIVVEAYDEKGEMYYDFRAATIYYADEENAYISKDLVDAGDYIINQSENDRKKISETQTLEGVYNVNKGYCVFRVIHKIYSNEEYSIVEPDSVYGISSYDHIVVDATTVSEQEIISKK